MNNSILSFRGEYDFLSNMYSTSFVWDGRTYRNSEAAFQSAKSLDPAVRDEFGSMAGVIAKRAGKKVDLRADWERVKDDIMEEVVRAKFSQNPELARKLTDTGDAQLVEGNRWHDTYWGVDLTSGKGENHLGKILMKIRAELGGAEYREKIENKYVEKEKVERAKAEKIGKQMEAVKAALDALPLCDLTGQEVRTKAFGTVRIKAQDGDYLKFDLGGREKTFKLPGCIVQGFVVLIDPAIRKTYDERLFLEEYLTKLEKGENPESHATRFEEYVNAAHTDRA